MIEHFLAQEMVSGGVELMLGMHTDPLGTAILVGMGGVTAELFEDHQLRLLEPGKSLSEHDALDMLKELKTWPLLDGYRGRLKCDVNALVQAIVAFSELVSFMGERLVECEFSPTAFDPGGEIGGAVSYNFKFVVSPRPAASGTFLPFRRILSETAVS